MFLLHFVLMPFGKALINLFSFQLSVKVKGFCILGMATSLGEGKLWIPDCCTLKIDLGSHLTHSLFFNMLTRLGLFYGLRQENRIHRTFRFNCVCYYFISGFLLHTVLLNVNYYIGTWRIQLRRVTVDLGVMAITEYSIFSKFSKLDSHHQM